MRHFLHHLTAFKNELSGKQLCVFLDYDGTIAPIADTPDKAVLPRKMQKMISSLAIERQVPLAIVSGRGLKDVKKMVGIKGLIYAGNHGLEIEGPGIEYTAAIPAMTVALVGSIKKLLSYKLGCIKGVFIEDKGVAVALHYRNVDRSALSMVEWYFNYVVQPYRMAHKIDVLTGKMVYEVRPRVDWNKGNAVMWLISKYKKQMDRNLLPIYIGDDVTDESVFKCLENAGTTIYVGEYKKSAAQYAVKDPEEVYEVLKTLEKLAL
jgi:trehalose-phosphatase